LNEVAEGLVPFSYLEDITPAAPPKSASHRPPPAAPTPSAPKSLAEENGECPICYYDWQAKPACVLMRVDGKRTCRHFLHKECVEKMAVESKNKSCPLCRQPWHTLKVVPDCDTDPLGWFSCVDYDQNGRLSKTEVMDVLGILLNVDNKALEKNIETLWAYWDPDGSGDVDYNECCGKAGLIQYVKQHFAKARGKPPPALSPSTREEFFTYWDEDGNGTLEKEEIVRAVIKTLRLETSKIRAVKEYLDNIWAFIDPDNSGEIDLQEFIQRDGLGEMLIAYSQVVRS